MIDEVFIDVGLGETRVAMVAAGQLQEVTVDRPDRRNLVGNIYLGRVQRVVRAMQAAFVDIGLERSGFLSARDAICLVDSASAQNGEEWSRDNLPPIERCVREGDSILVQLIKNPLGEKGARLSAGVTLPGRCLVHTPNQEGVGVSRRIEDSEEREQMVEVGAELAARYSGGFIMRTVARDADMAELDNEAERLSCQWQTVLERRAQSAAPACIMRDLDTVSRTLRDNVDRNVKRIVLNNAEGFAAAKRYCSWLIPEKVDNIELHNGREQLFDRYDIEEQIAGTASSRAELKSGGWITIEATEALTAIDVNSGRFTQSTSLEATSLHTNLEAAVEVARQLRLRGIGGLIVVDFIHLAEEDHIAQLLEVFSGALAQDSAPTQMSGMSEFGLVELTRKRTREPLNRLLSEACAPCDGQGRIPTVETAGFEVLRRAVHEAKLRRGSVMLIEVPSELANWFEGEACDLVVDLEQAIAMTVQIREKPNMARGGYVVQVETP